MAKSKNFFLIYDFRYGQAVNMHKVVKATRAILIGNDFAFFNLSFLVQSQFAIANFTKIYVGRLKMIA